MLIISPEADTFSVNGETVHDIVHESTDYLVKIKRLTDSRTHKRHIGYILNTRYHLLRVLYFRDDHTRVGPTHDYILPMQAKEIGAGPGVTWEVTEIL